MVEVLFLVDGKLSSRRVGKGLEGCSPVQQEEMFEGNVISLDVGHVERAALAEQYELHTYAT